jgi:hypothetical protein
VGSSSIPKKLRRADWSLRGIFLIGTISARLNGLLENSF